MGTMTGNDDDDDHRRAPQLVFYISNKGASPGIGEVIRFEP